MFISRFSKPLEIIIDRGRSFFEKKNEDDTGTNGNQKIYI